MHFTMRYAHSQVTLADSFGLTRSFAALGAADLDWIVGPGYSWGGYILEKNLGGINKNVTDIKRDIRGVTTDLGGINKNVTDTKRDIRGVTTDLLDV